MEAVIAQETKGKNTGFYHLLNDAGTGSLCASINEESQFASDIAEVLSQDSAERRGLNLCGRCGYLANLNADTDFTDNE